MTILNFLTSHAAMVVFGLPAAFLPTTRRFSPAGRFACAYGAGAIALTFVSMAFTASGVKWSVVSLAVVLVVLAGAGSFFLLRKPAAARRPIRISSPVAAASLGIIFVSVLALVQSIASGRSISVDFLMFWGIKAARFAHAGGIDVDFLTWVYATHAHANYPPLFSTTIAWTALVSPREFWTMAPFSAVIWFLLAVPLVFDLCRQRMADREAAVTAAFWSVALSAGLSHAFSGGNAEATLVFYETAAIGSLMFLPMRKWMGGVIAGIFLAGAVLTKLEGSVATAFMLGGAALSLIASRRREGWKGLAVAAAIPLLAGLTWLAFMLVHEIPLRDPTHVQPEGIRFDHLEAVIASQILNSGFGTRGMSWALPFGVIIVFAARWSARLILPLVFVAGLPLFTMTHYLQAPADPTELIGWTFPRLMLPALSALILAASLLLFGNSEETGEPSPQSES